MKAKIFSRAWLMALGLSVVFCAQAQAATNAVFRLRISMKGSFKVFDSIFTESVKGDDFVNLALGRLPPLARNLSPLVTPSFHATKPATNEVLALAIDCDTNHNARIIVFDSNTSSNLATIADLARIDTVSGRALLGSGFSIHAGDRQESLVSGPIQAGGSVSNGLAGGVLTLALIDNCRTNAPLTGAKGTVLGFIHLMIEGADFPGLITKGAITTQGSQIGILVDDP